MEYFRTYCSLPKDAIFIRKSVFMEEQGFTEEFDEKDSVAKHVVLYSSENIPMATCRYFQNGENKSYVVGRIAVLKEFRRKHYGAFMLSEVERQVKIAGAEELRLAAQVQATGFYIKMGFSIVGKEFFEEHCPHIWMCKKFNLQK